MDSRYVIITPARNEEEFIEGTIRAVVSQTLPPLRWVIVNDASTDRTAAIVEAFARQYDFIRLANVTREGGRNFGKKAEAFRHGLEGTQDLDYSFIGNLDADITVEREYFERLLREFAKDNSLGIAGGCIYTKIGSTMESHDHTLDSVAGAVQMFRRKCFEDIGGYLPLKLGGIDAAAEITARMKGWKVSKIPELRASEHRRTGTASAGLLRSFVQLGRRFHSLGYHPLFYVLRCLFRIANTPFLIGSAAELFGFFTGVALRKPIALPRPVVQYLRREQMQKLRLLVSRRANGLPRPT
jgi:glycosyltransferase involved in cell wall biosynthesis